MSTNSQSRPNTKLAVLSQQINTWRTLARTYGVESVKKSLHALDHTLTDADVSLNPRVRSQKLNTMSKIAIGVSNHQRLTMLSKFGKT